MQAQILVMSDWRAAFYAGHKSRKNPILCQWQRPQLKQVSILMGEKIELRPSDFYDNL
jgi:hypothetical protein